mmetsp:Transcript_13773/g.15696  ORF Transcript_13773/g.15696 Transcript_13773/m.15696 type:complete len:346 (-) Transcript_13773:534-1571(-)
MRVGVVGASGAVGEEIIKVLDNRKFPATEVLAFASERSAGKEIKTESYGVLTLQVYSFEAAKSLDYVFLAVSGSFAKKEAPLLTAVENGPIVIDNSSAFRYDDDIPLIVPEINIDAVAGKRLIANPNCTTAIAAMALWPLHQKFTIEKLLVSTYQAASGAGAEGMSELREQSKNVLNGSETENKVFAHPLPFNVIPHIDSFQENGYTREEMKVCWETRKIFGAPDLAVSCTAVRIPTFRAHAESLVIETRESISPKEATQLLSNAPGVKLVDDPSKLEYPMPLNATAQYDVEVGRIRQSIVFGDKGLELFVCGDQLLRGAALNAVIIAEDLMKGGKKRKLEETKE